MARITRRLKVYTTRIGIRDWVVAASSQKEALKAWDVRENLFASGAARETSDPTSVEIAMKNPGTPTPLPGKLCMPEEPSRPVRSESRRQTRDDDGKASDVIRLDEHRRKKSGADVIDLESRRKQRAERGAKEAKPEPRPGRGKSRRKAKADDRQPTLPLPLPPPDRSKLDAAEEALAEYEKESKDRRKELDKKRRALELEIESFDSETRRHRERLEKRVAKERDAFEEQRSSR